MPYFDHAATTFISKDVIKTMTVVYERYNGNPSSLHDVGIAARKKMNQAKNSIANSLNTQRTSLLFTGSGTEANNLAIKGFYTKHKHARFITSTVEHHATLNTFKFLEKEGADVVYVKVDHSGHIDFDSLKKALSHEKHNFISLIYINNELGTLLDLKKLKSKLDTVDHTLHLDMIQAPVHTPIDFQTLNIDMASLSAHKFNGPKGIGLLYIKNTQNIENLIHGGKQEFNKRAGTENLANICGFDKALTLSQADTSIHNSHTKKLSETLLTALDKLHVDYRLNGQPLEEKRISAILNLGFNGITADMLSFELNKLGYYVSLGSACDSDNIEASHVLKAINVPSPYIDGSIRISLSKENTVASVIDLANAIHSILKQNRDD